MVCSAENGLTMLLVQSRNRDDGLFLALVPHNLTAAQVNDGLAEIGIDPGQVLEVNGWEKATTGLAATFLPFPK